MSSRDPPPRTDKPSIVVHIDGACRNNGKLGAQAAYGIYFGPGSSYNTCDVIPPTIPLTSSRAEIEALVQARELVSDIAKADPSIDRVIFVSDSDYLVKSINSYMDHWATNGGLTVQGNLVKHFAALKGLHEDFESLADRGISYDLFQQPRRLIVDADDLANKALD
ncbi:ribonuclease H-like protein, partial [Eremomyces bilateralis CBS 781.70]